jgi:nifR3 family TIM-barrel protein
MAVQLFGSEPSTMAEAAIKALAYKPDFIDINMGCPAPKVVTGGAGSSLMKDIKLATNIIEAVVKAVELPVTVKMRKGWDDNIITAVELARAAEACGAAALTVHGRTRAQMYTPPVDLEIISRVKSAVKIPVIGNGDINSPEAAKRMLDTTGCDLVMIGRSALGAPWLFEQTESYLRTGSYNPEPDIETRMSVMIRHIKLICSFKGEYIGMREARKHCAWYLKGINGAAAMRNKAGSLTNIEDLERLASFAIEQSKID